MNGGWALDKSAVDPATGKRWNLNDPHVVRAAWRLLYKSKPQLLICSPPCTVFSQIQGLNEPVSLERWEEAISYIDLCVSMCRAQLRAGRHFVLPRRSTTPNTLSALQHHITCVGVHFTCLIVLLMHTFMHVCNLTLVCARTHLLLMRYLCSVFTRWTDFVCRLELFYMLFI